MEFSRKETDRKEKPETYIGEAFPACPAELEERLPFLGAHMSIAGGVQLAFDRLKEVRGEALQMFTTNHRQWKGSALSPQAIDLFKMKREEAGHIPVASHAIYLINLAASDPEIAGKSIIAFAEELRRCDALGIGFVIMHPGAHLGEGFEQGLERFVKNLDLSIEKAGTEKVSVLLEVTAGQGSCLGSNFEQLSFMLQTSRYGGAMGVCYDTCHAFAAGYDIRTEGAYNISMDRFDTIIGLDRLKFFHLNDSKKGLFSRVDRHEHIGKGTIGLEGFRLLLNDPRFRSHPMVLETPKGKDLAEDKENLRVLRSLILS